jgi:hypothetical protein
MTTSKRKLVAIKDREFSLELAPFTNEQRYIHRLEAGADGNNVKRQFDDILFAQGLAKGNVRFIQPDKILLSTEAHQIWQKFKELEPGRKKRTLPECRQFNLYNDHKWVHNLSNNEIARIVAGTIKHHNIVCIDNHSLANYLNAIKDKKPALLGNPEYQQYVNQTLQSISAISKNLAQTSFKKFTHYSDAQTISSFGIHAQKRKTVSRGKAAQAQPAIRNSKANA